MTGDQLTEDIFWHLLIIGAGVLVAVFPGLFATIGESFDAVGSKRSDVEPTQWRVLLTRAVGVGIILVGSYLLVYEVWRIDLLNLFAILVV